MADQEVMRIRVAFDHVKIEMSHLKERLHEIDAGIDAGCFVSSEMVDILDDVLMRYREQASALEVIGSELSIPIGEDITAIENAITLYEQKRSSLHMRSLVLDYFRLTAEAADVKKALEDSKRKLIEKCALDSDQLSLALEPYGTVVNHIRGGETSLTDASFDLVENEIGRPIARAVDRGDLTIDENYDITSYLDNSCPLLTTSQVENDDESNAEKDSGREAQTAQGVESITGEQADLITADTEESDIEVDDSNVSDLAQEPILPGYQGIAKGVIVKITDNPPASSLKASEFKSLCKQKGNVPVAMFWLGHEKLQDASQHAEPAEGYYVPDLAIIEYLHNHGYMASLSLECNLMSKNYLTLSEKGWTCYSKQDTVRFLSSELFSDNTRILGLLVPLFMRYATESWDEQTTLDTAVVHDFFARYHRNNQIFKNTHSGFVCGDLLAGGEKKSVRVCSGIFAEETGQGSLSSLKQQIAELEGEDILVVVVYAEQDIRILANTLDITSPHVLFSVLSDDYRILTAQGEDERIDGISADEPQNQDSEDDLSKPEEKELNVGTEVVPVSEELPPEVLPEQQGGSNESTSTEEPAVVPSEATLAPGEETKHQQYIDGMWRMETAGRTDVAAVMLKSLVYREPELQMLANQFAYATGDPSIEGGINGLNAAFGMPAGHDVVIDTLAIAAYLRMYFSSAASEQIYLSRDFSHQKDNLALKRFPELEAVLYDLSNWVRYQYRGLDGELIELLLQKQNTGVRQRALRQRAQDFLNNRLTESLHSNKQIKETRNILFASGSDIWNALTGIKDDHPDTRQMAERVTNKDIDKTIDDAWNEASRQLSFSRNERCIGVERTTLTRQLRSIMTLINEWLSVNTAERHTSNAQTEAAAQLIQNLRPKLDDCLKRLSVSVPSIPLAQQGAEAVLKETVKQCLDRITGTSTAEEQAHNYYINLLKEPLIALDDLNQPHIETPDEEIEPYDFCRRAMQYLDAPSRSWEEVLKRIFSETGSDHLGMDYGCAKVLQEYLTTVGKDSIWKNEYNIDNAIADALDRASVRRTSVVVWEQDFTARLEMAEGDNWFEADQNLKSHIQKVINRQKETYFYADNFGFYGRAMNRLFERLRSRAQSMRTRYNEELTKLRNGRSEEELSQPIFEQIQEMISNDRFGAAESFIQQVRVGNLTIGNGELTSGTLQDFIERLNSELYRIARLDSSRKPLSAVFEGMHKKLMNSTLKTGYSLLKAWPEGNALQGDKLRTFFVEMDLMVASVTGQGTEFFVKMQDRGIIQDYPHPIADFGSYMDQRGIDVALITGNRDANGYHSEIEKLLRKYSSNRPLLLFVNSPIRIDDRRKLAKSVGRLTSSKPFLLLDRCLALYLAEKPKTDRWKILLRCSLPFRVINPYFENSKLPIPPDMFIGRRREIQEIIAPSGPNLLYGGRQLGKTAILHRVELLENHPEKGHWASYVDIRDMNHEDAIITITKALIRNEFFPINAKPVSWKELIACIEDQLMDKPDNKVHNLLLMMDEADHVLKLFEEEYFQTLGDLKRLEQTTDGRFKFILAGLHNVLRLSQKALVGNSALPHLSGIVIEPMKFSDGRELLEVPLSYLGFTIEPGQEDIIAQILYNTNYYPGLIHFYASRLVEHMKEHSPELTMPPYKLSRDILLRMIGDETFRQQRKDKLMMTLKVDERDPDSYYYILAYALAMASYDSEEVLLHGASAQTIRNICISESSRCRVGKLTDQQLEALLDELVTLNILRQEKRSGTSYYLFSRNSFLEMLGDEETVIESLLNALEKEEQSNDAC